MTTPESKLVDYLYGTTNAAKAIIVDPTPLFDLLVECGAAERVDDCLLAASMAAYHPRPKHKHEWEITTVRPPGESPGSAGPLGLPQVSQPGRQPAGNGEHAGPTGMIHAIGFEGVPRCGARHSYEDVSRDRLVGTTECGVSSRYEKINCPDCLANHVCGAHMRIWAVGTCTVAETHCTNSKECTGPHLGSIGFAREHRGYLGESVPCPICNPPPHVHDWRIVHIVRMRDVGRPDGYFSYVFECGPIGAVGACKESRSLDYAELPHFDGEGPDG